MKTLKSLCLLMIIVLEAFACTGTRTISSEGDMFRGRTMEFAADIPSELIFIPRGMAYTGTTVEGQPGLNWITQYAVSGATGFGLPQVVDGVNEKGLSAGAFYFANYVGYQIETDDKTSVLAPYELVTWILTSFESVDEVRQNVDRVTVPEVVLDQFGFCPPLHYIVMDTSGDCVVLEHIEGILTIHDNPFGIITNSPSFEWHMTNLNNYINLSVLNREPTTLEQVEIKELGMGSGLLGMPGDFTPPSRFIRSFDYSLSAIPALNSNDAVLQAFHILNQFDIPVGASRKPGIDESGNIVCDYTLWSSVTDLSQQRYYVRTHENSRIRMIELESLDLNGSEVLFFPLNGDEQVEDVTSSLAPEAS